MLFISCTLLILVYALTIGQVASCDTHGMTNGCSIPCNLPFFYKEEFKAVCDRHDICYDCGYGMGVSRFKCDRKFYYNLIARCDKEPMWLKGFCHDVATFYFLSVRHFGYRNNKRPSSYWCKRSWVPGCMSIYM